MKNKILLTFAILTLTIPVSTANAKGCKNEFYPTQYGGTVMMQCGKVMFTVYPKQCNINICVTGKGKGK